MSNQQWPQQGGQGPNPWSQPDPSWAAPQFTDKQGRDPRQPFGQQPTAGHAPRIEDFQHDPNNRNNKTTIWVIVAIVAAVAVLLLALNLLGAGDDEPQAGETDGPRITFDPTSAATASDSIPFEGNGTGTFEVLSSTWSGDEVTITYRITLDAGQESFALYLFDNQSMESYNPTDHWVDHVEAGAPLENTVSFIKPQGASTLVLTSGTGRAITALPISG